MTETVRFYRHDGQNHLTSAATVPSGLAVAHWRPNLYMRPANGLPPAYWVWTAFARTGVFANRHAGALMFRDAKDTVVFRALVTPKWHRFPDMRPGDLQIGDVWTRPDWRGRGLAKAGIAEIARRWHGQYDRLWYIVDDANIASIRVIEACGFALVGQGERTRPFGLSPLGQYRIRSDR